MTEYVHVRIKDTGAKGSIPVKKFNAEVYEKTGEDPLGRDGLPRPWKAKTTVAKAASRRRTRKNSAKPESPAPVPQEPTAPLEPQSTEGAEPDETGLQADTPKEND